MFKLIYYCFLGFIGLIAVLLILSAFPIPGNFKAMIVQSGSMTPAIKMGDVVIVKPVKDYKVGDVITFYPYGKDRDSTTHRIYEKKLIIGGDFVYITKGDANSVPDIGEITESDILGKVLFSIPLIGYVLDFAKKPLGFALFIAFPAIIVIFDEARKIYRELKKKS